MKVVNEQRECAVAATGLISSKRKALIRTGLAPISVVMISFARSHLTGLLHARNKGQGISLSLEIPHHIVADLDRFRWNMNQLDDVIVRHESIQKIYHMKIVTWVETQKA
ncbi:hypothetical protein F2P45_26105 [Massilia sp. CCM 8733]|uniref:Uncharacterized protein n=1 Tax=Massilia mucilaginosa TaxID=2609282 RepID=A0ABX0NZL8_9BURK|nr:hypothetical protein [Massilia mucilaginosa]NHZ92453.1 hypothetical protein [Massilia mucilaginosa]